MTILKQNSLSSEKFKKKKSIFIKTHWVMSQILSLVLKTIIWGKNKYLRRGKKRKRNPLPPKPAAALTAQ